MNFIKDYPNLFQFFVGYFPDSDFNKKTDADVVAEYALEHILINNHKKIEELVADIDQLMVDIDNYWEEVGVEANRYFENSQDAFEWLNMIKKGLIKICDF